MRIIAALVSAMLFVSCASTRTAKASLDGARMVVEGRWNGRAKSDAQILCYSAPFLVDVVGISGRRTPEHQSKIRVIATLRWRHFDAPTSGPTVQVLPDSYVIDWAEAEWLDLGPADSDDYEHLSKTVIEKLDAKKGPNQPPEPTVMSVTPRADARVAPATTVAHL